MAVFISGKGVTAEVYTKAEIDMLLAQLPDMSGRLDEIEAAHVAIEAELDLKVDGLNGVEGLFAGTEAELAEIEPKDPAVVYVAIGEDEDPGDPGDPDELSAQDDNFTTPQDTPITLSKAVMLSNDTGVDLRFTSADQPTNGTLTDDGADELIYTPNAGFTGDDSFAYRIADAVAAVATGMVHMNVTAA